MVARNSLALKSTTFNNMACYYRRTGKVRTAPVSYTHLFASADDLSICFDIEKEIIKVVFQNTVWLAFIF